LCTIQFCLLTLGKTQSQDPEFGLIASTNPGEPSHIINSKFFPSSPDYIPPKAGQKTSTINGLLRAYYLSVIDRSAYGGSKGEKSPSHPMKNWT
jgi:hypothetical protein